MTELPSPGPDVAVYVISVAAELSGLHPQTLRAYERLGLVTPGRTGGGGRRYSHRDVAKLRSIEGVRRLLELEHQLVALQARNAELVAELEATREAFRRTLSARPPADRLPVLRPPDPGQSVVIWRRGF
jgi:MerR family transcriptional regulator/heat shock protein HspR